MVNLCFNGAENMVERSEPLSVDEPMSQGNGKPYAHVRIDSVVEISCLAVESVSERTDVGGRWNSLDSWHLELYDVVNAWLYLIRYLAPTPNRTRVYKGHKSRIFIPEAKRRLRRENVSSVPLPRLLRSEHIVKGCASQQNLLPLNHVSKLYHTGLF